MKEIWKDVVGYEDRYEVSNFGGVRSKSYMKYGKNMHGVISFMTRAKTLSLGTHTDGYKQVSLCKNGTRTTFKVHRLVAFAFIHNPENKPQINHKNSVRWDNRVENLEWCNNQENIVHSYSSGSNSNAGELHPRNVLNNSLVYEIRRLYDSGVRCIEIANRLHLKVATVEKAAWRVNWKHLPEEVYEAYN